MLKPSKRFGLFHFVRESENGITIFFSQFFSGASLVVREYGPLPNSPYAGAASKYQSQ